MRTFGLLSLILALVIVGLLAKKQLNTTHQTAPIAASQAASSAGIGSPSVGRADDAPKLQDQVKDDVNKVMQDRASQVNQGLSEADKP